MARFPMGLPSMVSHYVTLMECMALVRDPWDGRAPGPQ